MNRYAPIIDISLDLEDLAMRVAIWLSARIVAAPSPFRRIDPEARL